MKKLIALFITFIGFQANAEVRYIEDVMRKALDEEKDIAKVFESIDLEAIDEKQGSFKVVKAKDIFQKQGIQVGDILYSKLDSE